MKMKLNKKRSSSHKPLTRSRSRACLKDRLTGAKEKLCPTSVVPLKLEELFSTRLLAVNTCADRDLWPDT